MSITEQYNQELYHYGVKGMKWGHRKSRDERATDRANKYISREVSKIEKRRAKQRVKEDRAISKQEGRYYEKVHRYGKKSNKAKNAGAKYAVEKAERIINDKIAKAEIEKLKSMKVSDVKAEKKKLGQAYAKTALINVGGIAALALGSPVGVMALRNGAKTKTSVRVSQEERDAIYLQAYAEAGKKIYY